MRASKIRLISPRLPSWHRAVAFVSLAAFLVATLGVYEALAAHRRLKVELDPSFKQNTFTANRDVAAAVGLNPENLLINIKANATVDPGGEFVSDVPEAFILSNIALFASPLRDYLAANDLTIETVFRQRTVQQERFGILPAADNYPIVARGLNFSALPNELKHFVTLRLLQPDGTESLAHTAALSEWAGRRVTLSYVPETPADAASWIAWIKELE